MQRAARQRVPTGGASKSSAVMHASLDAQQPGCLGAGSTVCPAAMVREKNSRQEKEESKASHYAEQWHSHHEEWPCHCPVQKRVHYGGYFPFSEAATNPRPTMERRHLYSARRLSTSGPPSSDGSAPLAERPRGEPTPGP